MIDRPDRITVTEEYRDMVKRTNPVIQQLHIDENAELFERAVKQGYALEAFITAFMQSDAAFRLDMPLNQYRWEGTEGLWEDFIEEILLQRDAVGTVDGKRCHHVNMHIRSDQPADYRDSEDGCRASNHLRVLSHFIDRLHAD